MRKSEESFKRKIESAAEIERTLIEIGSFDSVKVGAFKAASTLNHYEIIARKDGRLVSVKIDKFQLSEWARRCEQKGRFKSVAHPIKKKLMEELTKQKQ